MRPGRQPTAQSRLSNSYESLIAVCRTQVRALGINYAILDVAAGFTDGYAAKLLGHSEYCSSGGRRTKRHFSPKSFGTGSLHLWVQTVEHRNGSAPQRGRRPRHGALRPSARQSPTRRTSWQFGTRAKPADVNCGSTQRSAPPSRRVSLGSPTHALRANRSAQSTCAPSTGIPAHRFPACVVPAVLIKRAVRETRNVDGRAAIITGAAKRGIDAKYAHALLCGFSNRELGPDRYPHPKERVVPPHVLCGRDPAFPPQPNRFFELH